jgi:hypothetical protein
LLMHTVRLGRKMNRRPSDDLSGDEGSDGMTMRRCWGLGP